ncbi:hypothetical protein ACTMKN_04975 [Bacteroides pyogenes]|uniref:hypothetical protein n=1 Tax=Bacteroides pyogenes TaxID=310300 RepID=UPI0011E4344C|nr:hypothetical protein [Bacteroides pyogenes]TYK39917.1 hypothetical protein FNJ59_06570 [Bacteroides pyogenes]
MQEAESYIGRQAAGLCLYHLVADEEAKSYTARQTAIYDVLDAKAVGSRELYSQADRRLSGIGGYAFCCRGEVCAGYTWGHVMAR